MAYFNGTDLDESKDFIEYGDSADIADGWGGSDKLFGWDGNDLCRVHVKPSGHPVHATVTVVDKQGQHQKKRMFYVRMNNGTRAIDDEAEIEKYIANRW